VWCDEEAPNMKLCCTTSHPVRQLDIMENQLSGAGCTTDEDSGIEETYQKIVEEFEAEYY